MQTILTLFALLALAPFAIGATRLPPTAAATPWPGAASVLLCALAFNLTFFWQELWLVIPKAMTPGLHPVLFHNDHTWTGHAPVAELLQGTGAVATFVSGSVTLVLLAWLRPQRGAVRLLLFWLAFQGLFQSLSQLAIGSLIAGNDVGRALDYLGANDLAKLSLLAGAVVGMAAAGRALASLLPAEVAGRSAPGSRAAAWTLLATALATVALVAPFRVPRDPIEVVLIPAFVNLIGVGWLVLGLSYSGRSEATADARRIGVLGPAAALGLALAIFQLVLRRGIAF